MTDACAVTGPAHPIIRFALARRPVKQRARRRPRRLPTKRGHARRTGGVRELRRRRRAMRQHVVQVANRRLYMENRRIMEENSRLRDRALLLREENTVLLRQIAGGNSCQDPKPTPTPTPTPVPVPGTYQLQLIRNLGFPLSP